jgi:CheY-like chemotaxis protein
MEAILSATHKLILQFAPSGPLADPRPAPPEPKVNVPQTHSLTILLVDDEQMFLEDLETYLSRPGITIVTARTSSEALKAIVEHEFDLVVTDLVMPSEDGYLSQMDGREVALAAKRSSAKTKVVLLTAYILMSEIGELIKWGIDNILSKADFEVTQQLRSLLDTLAPGTTFGDSSKGK